MLHAIAACTSPALLVSCCTCSADGCWHNCCLQVWVCKAQQQSMNCHLCTMSFNEVVACLVHRPLLRGALPRAKVDVYAATISSLPAGRGALVRRCRLDLCSGRFYESRHHVLTKTVVLLPAGVRNSGLQHDSVVAFAYSRGSQPSEQQLLRLQVDEISVLQFRDNSVVVLAHPIGSCRM